MNALPPVDRRTDRTSPREYHNPTQNGKWYLTGEQHGSGNAEAPGPMGRGLLAAWPQRKATTRMTSTISRNTVLAATVPPPSHGVGEQEQQDDGVGEPSLHGLHTDRPVVAGATALLPR